MTIEEIKNKFDTKTVVEINYNDFNKLVDTYFGLTGEERYECNAIDCWGNDSSHSFDVDLKWVSERGIQEVEKAREQNRLHLDIYPSQMLDYLCYKGVIEKGNYLIKVSW